MRDGAPWMAWGRRRRPRDRMPRAIRWLALASSLWLGACPSAPGGGGARRDTRPPSASDLEGIALVSLDIAPSGPPATKYGAPVQHALTEVEQAVVTALAGLPVTHAPALSRMVRELAAKAPDRNTVPPTLVDGLMAWAGLVDPPPRLVLVELPEDPEGCHRRMAPGCRPAVASLVEQVRATLPDQDLGPIAVGVGVAALREGGTRMMVAVLERAVELDPLPVAVGRSGSFSLTGRLLGARTKPWVEVIGPGGRSTTLPAPVAANGRFAVRVGCHDGPGAYQVEVMAEGRYGVEVAANFPVYCGISPPDTIAVEVESVDPAVSPAQLARANFLFLNEERRARGLPPLVWAEDAAAVAEAHSQDMLAHGFVGHTSPTTGDVTARFRAARLEPVVIRENVARGYGPKGIHESLMNSPGHRVNILATDVTHVGVGVVVGSPETNVEGAPRPLFATQNFYRLPGATAPTKDLGPALQARVDEARKARGLPAVRWNAQISAIAQRLADARAKDRAEPKGWHEEMGALGFASVESIVLSSADFDAIVKAELWPTLVHEVGLGVVRMKARGGGEEFLAVVLVAERP
jgi:uncharacterized protein YkwD